MDLGIIIAIVGSAIAIIGMIIFLCLLVRKESNSDILDILNKIIAIQDDVSHFKREMAIEIKNLYGSIYLSEEDRNKK